MRKESISNRVDERPWLLRSDNSWCRWVNLGSRIQSVADTPSYIWVPCARFEVNLESFHETPSGFGFYNQRSFASTYPCAVDGDGMLPREWYVVGMSWQDRVTCHDDGYEGNMTVRNAFK